MRYMGFLDQIDKDSLVCTFCGKKPVVAFTFAIDVEGWSFSSELVQDSIVATCKEHVAILQEQFEKEVGDAEFIGGVNKEDE
jgi:hypothetical protein